MDEKRIEELLEKMSEACDGHPIADIMTVMSSMIASIIDGMEFEQGVPLAFSVSMMAIGSAYDIEPDSLDLDHYLQ